MPVDHVSARPFQAPTSAAQHDAAGLREGSLIDGRVIGVNTDETLRVATRFGTLDVDPDRVTILGGGRSRLQPLRDLIGAIVRLEVTGTGQTTGRLQVRLVSGDGASQSSTSSEADPEPSSARTAARIAADISQAAARQDSLAPVFAMARDMEDMAEALPDRVVEALADFAGHALDSDLSLTADDLRQSFSASGLFLEATLAKFALESMSAGQIRPDAVGILPRQDLKAALFQLKSALNVWINSTIGTAESSTGPSVPMAVAVASDLAAVNPNSTVTSRSDDLPAAFDTEALFAVLRPPPVPQGASAASAGPADAPHQLGAPPVNTVNGHADLVTIATLGEWFQASGQLLPGNGGRRNTYDGRGVLADSTRRLSCGSTAPAPSRPPPPRRGSLPRGQPAYNQDNSIGRQPIELARDLSQRSLNAIARISLSQYASLPEPMMALLHGLMAATGDASPAKAGASWVFEIPIRLNRSTSIAQVEIDQLFDAEADSQSGRPGWRVQFATDIAPLGPVHARLLLADRRLSVGLWAENGATAAALQQTLPGLRLTLEAADFVIDEIHLAAGRPPSGPPVRAGGFVDRNA